MKLVRYYTAGTPDVLQLEDVEIPQPEAGQILVKVEAIDTGYIDTQVRSGQSPWGMPPLPIAPGNYVYGTAVQVGADVDNALIGKPLLGFAPSGAYAEYALVPLALCYPELPETSLSPAELVALPATGETAYHLLATAARLREGESVMIHAAAGGVGHFAVQLARAMGAGQIIATSGSAAKLEIARKLGADTLINSSQADWGEQVKAATEGKGVDIIIDVVGGQILVESVALLAPFGRLIASGAASGSVPTLPAELLSDLIFGLKRIEGFSSFTLMQHYPELIQQGRKAFFEYVMQGSVRPEIMHILPLTEIAEAHRLLESRASYGKIVIQP